MSKNYKEYIKSEEWQKKKQSLDGLGRDCLLCGSKNKLHAHHRSYKRLGNESILEDLIYLCKKHHFQVHNFAKQKKMDIFHATREFIKMYRKKNGFKWTRRARWNYWYGDSILKKREQGRQQRFPHLIPD